MLSQVIYVYKDHPFTYILWRFESSKGNSNVTLKYEPLFSHTSLSSIFEAPLFLSTPTNSDISPYILFIYIFIHIM
jgi:hypothetical protein